MYGSKNSKKKAVSGKTHLERSKLIVPFWCLYILCVAVVVVYFLSLANDDDIANVYELQERIDTTYQASIVYASDGVTELGRYYYDNRSNCHFRDISPNMINALIATEDARFMTIAGLISARWCVSLSDCSLAGAAAAAPLRSSLPKTCTTANLGIW